MTTTFGQLAAAGVLEYSDGYRTKKDQLAEHGFRILRVADVHDGWIGSDGQDFVDSAYESRIGQKFAREGDILLTTKGTIGRIAVVPDLPGERLVYSPQLCYFRVRDLDVLDLSYLRYWLASPVATRQIGSLSSSTDMAPYLSLRDIRTLEVDLPAVSVQRAIGEVLGALDDKIAANRRVIAAGDSLVRVLYSSTPKTPEGRTFADVADVGGGGTPSTKNPAFWDGGVDWATPTDVTGADGPWLARTSRGISEEGLRNCSSPRYPEGSILMTSRATIGAVVVARKPMAVNQGFIVLNAVEPEMQWWLESQVRARTSEFETWANGATFLEISRSTFKKLPVLECSPENLDKFNRTAQAVRERQWASQAENYKLARTRDELLPLLMSGRITVKDAERAAEDVL